MLDVVHYFFEDDMNYSTAEQAKAHEKLRESVYKNLYDSQYKYGSSTSRGRTYTASSGGFNFDEAESQIQEETEVVKPFNPRQSATKPYIPPTDYSQLGSVLDGPLN